MEKTYIVRAERKDRDKVYMVFFGKHSEDEEICFVSNENNAIFFTKEKAEECVAFLNYEETNPDGSIYKEPCRSGRTPVFAIHCIEVGEKITI